MAITSGAERRGFVNNRGRDWSVATPIPERLRQLSADTRRGGVAYDLERIISLCRLTIERSTKVPKFLKFILGRSWSLEVHDFKIQNIQYFGTPWLPSTGEGALNSQTTE